MTAPAMNSMQRTLTALSHQEPDRVPLFLLSTMHGAKELGISIEEYFSRAEYVVEGQLRLREKYRSDCLYAFFHASLETEAWGGTSMFIPGGPPLSGPPVIRSPGDILGLTPPEIAASPGLQRVLEAIQQLKRQAGDTVPIIGVAISPFSLPVMQLGFDVYLDLLHDRPDLFEHLMEVNIDYTVAWANAQLAAGATAICYFDPVSSTTSIPREQYLRTGQQVARRTIARIAGPTATHMASGRCLPIISDIADTGTAAVGVSTLEHMAELKEAARKRISLIGNLNAIEMRHWSPEKVEEEVRRVIARSGRGGGLILSDNHGEIPWQVPDEVLLAIGEAVERWGRYPLDWIDELQPGAA